MPLQLVSQQIREKNPEHLSPALILIRPSKWQFFTETNIAKAEKERDNSRNLRSAADGILRQTYGTYFSRVQQCS